MLTGTSFAAGLNVYATVATLGLLLRVGRIMLPASLDVPRNSAVIAVSLAMFGLEFVADMMPAFDLIWDPLHTSFAFPLQPILPTPLLRRCYREGNFASALFGTQTTWAAHGGKTPTRRHHIVA